MAVFKGDCSLLIDAGLGNTRRYSLRTENVTGAPVDRANWEGDAGSSITLFFRNETTGATPPGNADTAFELLVYYETGNGTLVKTLHSAATPPADGTSYTLHLTANGDSGGGARCGQLRLYIRADRDAVVAYDRNSDNNGGSGTSGTGDQGVIRSNMVVSDLAVSAYPTGAKFAYGAAADEQFTLTATHTQKFADRDNETFDVVVLSADDSTERESALDVEVGATTTTAQAFTVDDTYPTGDNGHGFRLRVNNNGLLLTTEKWTRPVASGANVTQDGTTAVKRSNFFSVNPDVTLGAAAPSLALVNRDVHTASLTIGATNARGEALTRSLSWAISDSGGTTKKTFTDSGPTYGDGGTSDYAPTGADKATYDAVGDQWTIQITTAGVRNSAVNAYKVSRKLRFSTLNNGTIDDRVFVGKAQDPTTQGVTRNRGQEVFWKAFLYDINGVLLGNVAGSFNVRPTGSETYDEAATSFTLTSGAFAGANAKYAIDTDETVGGKCLVWGTQSATGTNQSRTGTAGSGSFAETSTSSAEWIVDDDYVLETRSQKESTRNADAEDLVLSISAHVNYAFCQVLDTSNDPVNGVGITFEQIDPDGVVAETKTATTGADGWTPAVRFDPKAPESANWKLRSRVTTPHNGNSGQNDQTVSYVSPFGGNKTAIIDLGPVATVANLNPDVPTAREGDVPMPGDRILLGFGFAVRDPVTGVTSRVAIPATPKYALVYFDQDIAGGGANAGAYVLQSDNETWKKNTDSGYEFHFRGFKRNIDNTMAWVAEHGAAAQGVTTDNGYPTTNGTSGWPRRRIYLLVQFEYNGAEYLMGAKNEFGFRGSLRVQEIDGSPEQSILRLKLPNGTLTADSSDVVRVDITHDHTDDKDWSDAIERPD